MTKIVLLNIKENFTPVPPLGILYIGTFLKENGHEAWVYDVNSKKEEEILQEIKKRNPDIIGLTSMTTNYDITKKFNKRLRKVCPYAYYCWGGIHATALPIDTMEENKLDFLIYGEGEETILDVCNRIKEKKRNKKRGINLQNVKGVYYYHEGKIIRNLPRPFIEDLDSLPFPDRTLLKNFKAYLAPPGLIRLQYHKSTTSMFTSRGCCYNCIFCASKLVLGRKIRKRSPKNIIDEMRYLNKTFGITGINFFDDTFGTDKGWVKKFCEEFKKSKLDMIWCCQTRVNIAQDLETLCLIKDAGCMQVDIGCESGSDKILKVLKKGITTKMILKSFHNLKKLKIASFCTFIVGSPGETKEDIKKTAELAKKAPHGGVSFLILVPYPGSPLYKMAKEQDWFVEKNVKFDERWTNKESDIPVMEASFKAKELVKIRTQLENKFFLRNNLTIALSFLKDPRYFFKILRIILTNPTYMSSALKKRKLKDYLENIYQKLNEDLQNEAN